MTMSKKTLVVLGVVVAVAVGITFVYRDVAGPGAEPQITSSGPPAARRLNQEQYSRAIRHIFGDDIAIPGRFDPQFRHEGLLAIGDAMVTVTSSGLEQHELRAREIAAAVLGEERRNRVLGCAPPTEEAFDRACAEQFFDDYGSLLYRRPLNGQELDTVLALSEAGAEQSGDFYQGVKLGLSRLLVSPHFLFRIENSEPDPHSPGFQRLDSYSLASRLSFLLWDGPPDAELLAAAGGEGLHNPDVLAGQVDRMMQSPRFAEGVRAFFSDMYTFSDFDGLTKDQTLYPQFTSQVSEDAREQLLLTIVDLLVNRDGDYRELFTTRDTFLNRRLAALYGVPVEREAFEQWVPHTFAPDDQRGGMLTFAGFLMLDPTHEGQTSPTIRGQKVREQVMCHVVPPPPPDVDFDEALNVNHAELLTTRQRLIAHVENPTCAGCHAITDPIGLSMENYDAIGRYRTHENGIPIDVTGNLDGVDYDGLLELGVVLQESPSVANCLVQRVFEYGVGRPSTGGELNWLDYRAARFAGDGYVFKNLVRDIATSKAFRAVAADDAGLAMN